MTYLVLHTGDTGEEPLDSIARLMEDTYHKRGQIWRVGTEYGRLRGRIDSESQCPYNAG